MVLKHVGWKIFGKYDETVLVNLLKGRTSLGPPPEILPNQQGKDVYKKHYLAPINKNLAYKDDDIACFVDLMQQIHGPEKRLDRLDKKKRRRELTWEQASPVGTGLGASATSLDTIPVPPSKRACHEQAMSIVKEGPTSEESDEDGDEVEEEEKMMAV
jgi:hypothetical protein